MTFYRACRGVLASLMICGVTAPSTGEAAEMLLNGYYRVRFKQYDNLYLQKGVDADVANGVPGSDGTSVYLDHRFRFEPEFRLNPYMSMFVQADVFDNRVWGTDPVLEPFSDQYLGSAGTSQTLGLPTDYGSALAIKRAWAEIYTPVGRLKVGRSAMSNGMGMYFNDGNGWDSDYGDTTDRIQFLTRLGPIYALIGYDQIFEGATDYAFDAQAISAAIAYRSEIFSTSFYTYLQQDKSYPYLTSADGAPSAEGGGNAFDDDVHSGTINDLRLGTFDLWAQTHFGPVDIEFEGVLRYGTGTMALMPNGAAEPEQAESFNNVSIFDGGLAAKGSYKRAFDTYTFEYGMASGDSDESDSRFTAFAFDRDYRRSLLMFRVPMPTAASNHLESGVSANGNTAKSGYAISDAIYTRPSVRFDVRDGLSFDVAAMSAWTYNDSDEDPRLFYGHELMAGAHVKLWQYLNVRARGSVFVPGSFYDNVEDDTLFHNERAIAGELQLFMEF